MEEKLDNQTVRYIINHYIDMHKLLHHLGREVKPNGQMFCPFHDNRNTESAHLYEEQDGSYTIYCYSEHKLYFPIDLYKLYMPEVDLNQLATAIYSRLSQVDIDNIKSNVNKEIELPELPYIKQLKQFSKREITYKELLKAINMSLSHDETYILMYNIYNLPGIQNINDNKNKYIYYLNNYDSAMKVQSAFNIINKVPNVPDFLRDYLSSHGDVILIPNIIEDVVHSITFRNLGGDKQFLKLGVVSPLLYNLGGLPDDFHYGVPLVLVEGNFDCDVMKTIYPYTVASLTSTLSTNQIQLISNLTNKVIIAYDNDTAGNQGYWQIKKKLEALDIEVKRFKHYNNLKDAGDLIDIKLKDEEDYNYIVHSYKLQINSL